MVHINYKLKTTDQAADFDEFEPTGFQKSVVNLTKVFNLLLSKLKMWVS